MESAIEPKKKKITKRVRSTAYSWALQEESALIVAVEKRPPLWNAAVPEYKMPHLKGDLWAEVVGELGIQGMTSADEARNKWNNLRSNFKAFVQKQRAKKSGQGAIDPTTAAKYPHYAELLFIESADVENSSQSISTLHLDNAITDESFLHDLGQAAATYENTNSSTPSPLLAIQRRKRATSKASQSVSPTRSRSSSRDTAVELLQSLQQRAQSICHNDHFSSFGDFIAGRLRNLKPDQAVKMEKSITLAMYSCLESFGESTSPTANASSQTPTTSTAEQLDAETTPVVKPSPSVSQVIRPRSFRAVGLPPPPPARVVENLQMRPDNAQSEAVQVYTETLFPDYEEIGESDVECLIELSPSPY